MSLARMTAPCFSLGDRRSFYDGFSFCGTEIQHVILDRKDLAAEAHGQLVQLIQLIVILCPLRRQVLLHQLQSFTQIDTKRAVRQPWIEDLVLEYVIKLVQNEELLEYIAENTYQYYLAQNTDTTYTKSLQKALAETEKSISNLLKAIEAGIFNESTKDRMNELEGQKSELRVALAAAKLKEDLGLKKEHIVFFLHQFGNMDYSDIACQKRLIKTFVNSVFVYDDKVVLTFNYSGDNRTMTLKEIDAGLQQGIRIPCAVVHQKGRCPFGYLPFCCPSGLEPSKCDSPPDCRRMRSCASAPYAVPKPQRHRIPGGSCRIQRSP